MLRISNDDHVSTTFIAVGNKVNNWSWCRLTYCVAVPQPERVLFFIFLNMSVDVKEEAEYTSDFSVPRIFKCSSCQCFWKWSIFYLRPQCENSCDIFFFYIRCISKLMDNLITKFLVCYCLLLKMGLRKTKSNCGNLWLLTELLMTLACQCFRSQLCSLHFTAYSISSSVNGLKITVFSVTKFCKKVW